MQLAPPPPSTWTQHQNVTSDDEELDNLFSRKLHIAPTAPVIPSPPTSSTSANFSVSQHYIHYNPTYLQQQQQQPFSPTIDHNRDMQPDEKRERQNLYNLLQANGITLTPRAFEITLAFQRRRCAKPLEENCSAMDLLRAGERERERNNPVYNIEPSEWDNDYYGGGNVAMMEDEDNPCSVGERDFKPFMV